MIDTNHCPKKLDKLQKIYHILVFVTSIAVTALWTYISHLMQTTGTRRKPFLSFLGPVRMKHHKPTLTIETLAWRLFELINVSDGATQGLVSFVVTSDLHYFRDAMLQISTAVKDRYNFIFRKGNFLSVLLQVKCLLRLKKVGHSTRCECFRVFVEVRKFWLTIVSSCQCTFNRKGRMISKNKTSSHHLPNRSSCSRYLEIWISLKVEVATTVPASCDEGNHGTSVTHLSHHKISE
jgi:hypothetical protein